VKIGLDFLIHWLWTLTYVILALSGVAMIGARFGWILEYNIALADYIHRITAVIYIALAALAIGYEVLRVWRQESTNDLLYGIFGRKEYGLFTLLTTLLFVLSGVILWKSHHGNMPAVAFAMFVHEQLTYIAMASVIWHVYDKAHALLWAKKKNHSNLMFKPWFKLIIWFITSAYFYCVAAMLISIGGPQSTASQVERFMAGMMNAMKNSLMGIATMEGGVMPGETINLSAFLFVQLLLLAFVLGIYLIWKERKPHESR